MSSNTVEIELASAKKMASLTLAIAITDIMTGFTAN